MKKPRPLTPDELRLWRDTNRPTDKLPAHMEEDTFEEASTPRETPAAAPRSTSAKNLSPLRPLAPREAAKFFKPYGAVEATLDLHGLSKLDAYAQVEHFIRTARRAGKRHVTIITGKGRGGEVGVLRSNLPHWLNEPAIRPLISGFATARAEKGGHGVVHVLVKRLV